MKLLELHERTNPLKRQVSLVNICLILFCNFFCFDSLIEALTARLGAVGLASPTLVGEGLSDENDSNYVVLQIHDSSVASFTLISGLFLIFPGQKVTCMHPL